LAGVHRTMALDLGRKISPAARARFLSFLPGHDFLDFEADEGIGSAPAATLGAYLPRAEGGLSASILY
jgi:hypothetical protein